MPSLYDPDRDPARTVDLFQKRLLDHALTPPNTVDPPLGAIPGAGGFWFRLETIAWGIGKDPRTVENHVAKARKAGRRPLVHPASTNGAYYQVANFLEAVYGPEPGTLDRRA